MWFKWRKHLKCHIQAVCYVLAQVYRIPYADRTGVLLNWTPVPEIGTIYLRVECLVPIACQTLSAADCSISIGTSVNEILFVQNRPEHHGYVAFVAKRKKRELTFCSIDAASGI